MFDLKSSLKTALDALTYTPRTVTVFATADSTERALERLEDFVFTDFAIILGDWKETDSTPWSFGWSRVVNEVDLILCAKSADAKTALRDGSVAKVVCEGLNRTTLNNAHHIQTQVSKSEEIKRYNDTTSYQIYTATVACLEPASTNFTPLPNANAPTISITSPADGAEVEADFNSPPGLTFTATVSVVKGDAALSSLVYIVNNTTAGLQYVYTDSSPENGSNSHEFVIAFADVSLSDSVTLTVYIFDSNMMFGSHAHTFTLIETA